MFTSHCVVDVSQTLKYPSKGINQKHKPGKNQLELDQEEYHPVKCEVCNTQVAVFDKDEIYHFFNVLASHWMNWMNWINWIDWIKISLN